MWGNDLQDASVDGKDATSLVASSRDCLPRTRGKDNRLVPLVGSLQDSSVCTTDVFGGSSCYAVVGKNDSQDTNVGSTQVTSVLQQTGSKRNHRLFMNI